MTFTNDPLPWFPLSRYFWKMDDVIVYDLAIVGAGMFGSSCARWASEDVRSSILIGPSEIGKASSEIFGAWFDEGRITEMADSTTVWRILGNLLLYVRTNFFTNFHKWCPYMLTLESKCLQVIGWGVLVLRTVPNCDRIKQVVTIFKYILYNKIW